MSIYEMATTDSFRIVIAAADCPAPAYCQAINGTHELQ